MNMAKRNFVLLTVALLFGALSHGLHLSNEDSTTERPQFETQLAEVSEPRLICGGYITLIRYEPIVTSVIPLRGGFLIREYSESNTGDVFQSSNEVNTIHLSRVDDTSSSVEPVESSNEPGEAFNEAGEIFNEPGETFKGPDETSSEPKTGVFPTDSSDGTVDATVISEPDFPVSSEELPSVPSLLELLMTFKLFTENFPTHDLHSTEKFGSFSVDSSDGSEPEFEFNESDFPPFERDMVYHHHTRRMFSFFTAWAVLFVPVAIIAVLVTIIINRTAEEDDRMYASVDDEDLDLKKKKVDGSILVVNFPHTESPFLKTADEEFKQREDNGDDESGVVA